MAAIFCQFPANFRFSEALTVHMIKLKYRGDQRTPATDEILNRALLKHFVYIKYKSLPKALCCSSMLQYSFVSQALYPPVLSALYGTIQKLDNISIDFFLSRTFY